MSKLAAAGVFSGFGISAALGGVYLSEMFTPFDAEMKDGIEEFKKSGGGRCVQRLFDHIDISQVQVPLNEPTALPEDYFSPTEDLYGCVVVNWERTDYTASSGTDTSWEGNFRWLWVLAGEEKGFIMFNVISPDTTEKKLKVEGVFYLLSWIKVDKK